MATGTASAGAPARPGIRLRLPERIPDFGRRSLLLFQLIWFPAFFLALVGPLAGTYYRLSSANQNSALVAGSRAGLAVAENDLTRIRFPVGPDAAAQGVRGGDDIVEIEGIRVSDIVPMPGKSGVEGTESDYALFGELLYGTEDRDMLLRLRGADGNERDVRLRTGERNIEQGARGLGISPQLLSFADLLHLLTYPFLLASAWLLYRRNRFDVISSIVSLAILLTMATEQPSAGFLANVAGLPASVHQTLYDLGNICLLAGILLFPHGRLSPRAVLLVLASLPILLVLEGNSYRQVFMAYMSASVLTLLWRLRRTPPGDERQQLKWALFGFSGYALFLAGSLTADMLKGQAGSLSEQLAFEVAAGFAFGLAFLLLQLGLLVALLKYRLYDAEAVITRSASVALITVLLGALFAATMEGVKEVVLAGFGRDAGSTAPIVGAAISTILVNPIYERVQRWTEGRLHRNLVELRRALPECLRDIRHMATLSELAGEVLARVQKGVRPIRVALLVEGEVVDARGATRQEVRQWMGEYRPDPSAELDFDRAGGLFPIRLPLRAEEGEPIGWLLVGARPDRSCVSTAERDTLVEIANPIGRALRLVLRREAKERRLEETLAHHRQQIERLTARLAIDSAGSAA
jgi:hypothetical protein